MSYYHRVFLVSSFTPKRINRSQKVGRGNELCLSHIATYSKWNSGDIILPLCVKDSFMVDYSNLKWNSFQITFPYAQNHIDLINKTSGLVIGGGGLFIERRNQEIPHPSSWHWNCDVSLTRQLKVPVAIFAVGYNQFRGHDGLSEQFTRHIESFSDQIVLIGMRNTGSMNQIKKYLPEKVHDKVSFQPCPTTIIKKLYPQLFVGEFENERLTIGLNCAFDRADMRFGEDIETICNEIGAAIKQLSSSYNIKYVIHSPSDDQFIRYLNSHSVKYEVINLVNQSPINIIKNYRSIDLMIGMRGHSQLIPFGCSIPILSLISHDKLKYFLTDIGHEEWGIEITDKNLKNEMINKVDLIINNKNDIISIIDLYQSKFFSNTRDNVKAIMKHIN